MPKTYKWDLFVRLTHWIVAGSFLTNYLITEEGSKTHQWIGYLLMITICLRLIWGLIVHSPARLSTFKPSIHNAFIHIKQVIETKEDHHEGHNPAGAVMVWILWSGLLLTGFSGWATQLDMLWANDWLSELHGALANLTMLATISHIAAIVIMSHWTDHNYLKNMLLHKK